MGVRAWLLAIGLVLPTAAVAGKTAERGPAASASEIPALAKLLDKAGWEPTPELSGVFKTGSIFKQDGETHSLMVRSCFTAEEVQDTYTSAEVVSQMQAGVKVRFGLAKVEASGELVKKMKFGTPVHSTIERLAMVPTEACQGMLARVSKTDLERMYAVQEVLTAEIAEQTCGRIDASGRFVGLGKADAELQQACMQQSLEPVAVAYRVVPLSELVSASSVAVVPMVPATPTDCPFGEIKTFSVPAITSVSVNGEIIDVRGLEARTEMTSKLQQCGQNAAADQFQAWRTARRTTNIACSTGLGCYPIAIGLIAAWRAKKHKEEMVTSVQTGLSKEERKVEKKQARKGG